MAQVPAQRYDESNIDNQLPTDIRVTMFVNGLPKSVPESIRTRAWGLLNQRWSLTFLSKEEAEGMLLYIDAMALDLKRAVPAWEITDEFITELKNFQFYCYSLIMSSKIRPVGGINERLANIKSIIEHAVSGGKNSNKGWPNPFSRSE